VWLAFVLMLTIFHSSEAKTFCLGSFLARKKRGLPSRKRLFLSVQESSSNKKFCFRTMKNCQHQHKGKTHTKEKSQDVATSMKDAVADTVHPNGFET
jgi:hypothetical protein